MEIRKINDYEACLAIEVFNREFYKRTLGNNEKLQKLFIEERKTRNNEILEQYKKGEVEIFCLYNDDNMFAGTVMLEGDKVRHLAVRKYDQNKGYGYKLIEYLSNYAKEKGIKVLKVENVGKNTPFYEKCGFKVVSEMEFDRYPHVRMEKVL